MASPSEIARLLLVLESDPQIDCPIACFTREVVEHKAPHQSMTDAVTAQAQHCAELLESMEMESERCEIARDKLRAELHLVEGQLASLAARRKSLEQYSAFCKVALAGLISAATIDVGALPATAVAPTRSSSNPLIDMTEASYTRSARSRSEDNAPTSSAPPTTAATTSRSALEVPHSDDRAAKEAAGVQVQQLSPAAAPLHVGAEEVVSIVQHHAEVKEAALVNVLSKYDSQCIADEELPWLGPSEAASAVQVILVFLQHIALPRPPIQAMECHIISALAKRAKASANASSGCVISEECFTLGAQGLTKLLSSVSDEVKAAALESLAVLMASETARRAFCSAGGVAPLVSIVATSSSELVLEKSLVALWTAAASDQAKGEIREADGLRAVVDLLYSDSTIILENAAIALGYLTRDDDAKKVIRECSGLEKLIASLFHPLESVQSKAAGALWNCASDDDNRRHLRNLGCVPALVELLASPDEQVQENAAGVLWNLAVDNENKAQILDYNGIPLLVRLLSSKNDAIVENAVGALWNCSAIVENRAATRKAGGIPPLLELLRHPSQRIQESAAGTLRNCAVNDQNKAVIREAGGIDIILDLLPKARESVQDKLASTLWIATVAPENKHAVRTAKGLPSLVEMLYHSNEQLQEKLLGILRNCSSVAENRQPLLQARCLAALAAINNVNGRDMLLQRRAPYLENFAGLVWNLSRDDKDGPRTEGVMQLLLPLLSVDHEGVVEQAAGAVSSLTINNIPNRELVRESGGLSLIAKCVLKPFLPEKPYALQNALLSLRNCTSSTEASQRICVELGLIPRLLELMATGLEEIVREAVLCIKNLAADRVGADSLLQRNAVAMLSGLAEKQTASEQVRKAAAMALQQLTKTAKERLK